MASESARVAVQLTLSGAAVFGRSIRSATGAIGFFASGIASAQQNLFFFVGLAKDAARVGQSLAQSGINLVGSLIGPNVQFEQARLQFVSLLGSVEAADERIRDLFRFANTTPFETEKVLQAGRVLEAFGGEALGAGDGLRLVGDMAAFAGTEFQEVAIWVGRAFSAIQSGRPFGEAAQRLQELALLTGQERTELEDLSESGAEAEVVWSRFIQIMSKTEGSTQRLADSFTGVRSTITSQVTEIRRQLGLGLFESFKAELADVRDFIDDAFETGRIQRFAQSVSDELVGVFDVVRDQFLGGLSAEDLFTAAEQQRLGDLFIAFFKTAAANFGIAMVNAGREFGPQVMEAFFGQSPILRRLLGLDRLERFQGIRSGEIGLEELTGREFSQLQGFLRARGQRGARAPVIPEDDAARALLLSQFAGSQLQSQQPLPFQPFSELRVLREEMAATAEAQREQRRIVEEQSRRQQEMVDLTERIVASLEGATF